MSNLDVDYQFFEEHVWPELVNRADCFAEAKARCSPLFASIHINTVEVAKLLDPSSPVLLLAPSLSRILSYPILS